MKYPLDFGNQIQDSIVNVITGIGGTNIKLIQHITTTITSASHNVTIPTAIDTNRTAVILNGFTTISIMGNSDILPVVILTSSTNINVAIPVFDSNFDVSLTVIQYEIVKSKQTGTLTLTGTTSNPSINQVDLIKSILIYTNDTDVGGSSLAQFFVLGEFLSSTQLGFTRGETPGQSNIAWQVLEF